MEARNTRVMRSAHSIVDALTSNGQLQPKALGGGAASVTTIPGAATVSGITNIATVAGAVASPASQRANRLARRSAQRDLAIAAVNATVNTAAIGSLGSLSQTVESADTAAVGASASVAAAGESSPSSAVHALDGSTSVSTLESGGGACAVAAGDALAASNQQANTVGPRVSGGNDDGSSSDVSASIADDSAMLSDSEHDSAVLASAAVANAAAPATHDVGDNHKPPALESDRESDDEALSSGTGGDVFATPAPCASKNFFFVSGNVGGINTPTSSNAASSSAGVSLIPEDEFNASVSSFPIDLVIRELLKVAVTHKLVAKGDGLGALVQRAIEQRDEFKCTPAFVAQIREAVAQDGWSGEPFSFESLEHVAGLTGGFPLRILGRDLRSPMTYVRNLDGVGGGGRQETLTGASVLVLVCASSEATAHTPMDVIQGYVLACESTPARLNGDRMRGRLNIELRIRATGLGDSNFAESLRCSLLPSSRDDGGLLYDAEATRALTDRGNDCILVLRCTDIELPMLVTVDSMSVEAGEALLRDQPIEVLEEDFGLKLFHQVGENSADNTAADCQRLSVVRAVLDALFRATSGVSENDICSAASALRFVVAVRARGSQHYVDEFNEALCLDTASEIVCPPMRLNLTGAGSLLEIQGQDGSSQRNPARDLTYLVLLDVLGVPVATQNDRELCASLVETVPWSQYGDQSVMAFARRVREQVLQFDSSLRLIESVVQRWSDSQQFGSAASVTLGVADKADLLKVLPRFRCASREKLRAFSSNQMGDGAALELMASMLKEAGWPCLALLSLDNERHLLRVRRLADSGSVNFGTGRPVGALVHGGGTGANGDKRPLHYVACSGTGNIMNGTGPLDVRVPSEAEQIYAWAVEQNRARMLRSAANSRRRALSSQGVGDARAHVHWAAAILPVTSTSAQSLAATAASADSSSPPSAAVSGSSTTPPAAHGSSLVTESTGGSTAATSSDSGSATSSVPASASPMQPPPPPPAPQLASSGVPAALSAASAAVGTDDQLSHNDGNGDSCFNCGRKGHRSNRCKAVTGLDPNFQGCYRCLQMGHKKASCKNQEARSVAASSSSGGASGVGKCNKCGKQARTGLTTCAPCSKQSGAPIGLNPANVHAAPQSTHAAAQYMPSFAEAAASNKQENPWTDVFHGGRRVAAARQQALVQQQQQEANRKRLKQESEVLAEIEKFSTSHRRDLAKLALCNGETVDYVRAALFDKTLCILGSACGGGHDGCFRRHSLPSNIVASGPQAASGSATGVGSSSGDAGNRNHAHGGRGRGGGRGGGRAGPAPGHGGEKNGGAQLGGASSVSSQSVSSASLSASAPVAAATASAASDPVLMARVDNIEGALASIMSQLGVLAAASVAAAAAAAAAASSAAPTSAAATAAASGAQQTVAGSQ